MNKFKNIMGLASVYIGTVIGAGFATGKEIISFFIVYGEKWIYGLCLAGLLFGVLGWAVLDISRRHKIYSYKGFIDHVFGKKLGGAVEIVTALFLCVLFFAMVSAAGVTVKTLTDFPPFLGAVIFVLLCCVVFVWGIRGIVTVNTLLSPAIIIGGGLTGIFLMTTQSTEVFSNQGNWILSAVIYVSYNIITAVSVLVAGGRLADSGKTSMYSGLIGGLAIGFLGICVGGVLYGNFAEIKNLEIPIFYVAEKYGSVILMVYTAVIGAAVFTTAIGNGFGGVCYFEETTGWNRYIIILLFFIMGVFAYFVPFSYFVDKAYRFFGYIGLLELVVILFVFAKENILKFPNS